LDHKDEDDLARFELAYLKGDFVLARKLANRMDTAVRDRISWRVWAKLYPET
jgi:hypothetical protein